MESKFPEEKVSQLGINYKILSFMALEFGRFTILGAQLIEHVKREDNQQRFSCISKEVHE